MTALPVNEGVIALQIQNYITEEILRDGSCVDLDENLLLEGLVDSLGMLRLVGFLESEHQIKISPEHFTIENFRSIRSISAFVAGLLAPAATGESIS